LIANCRGIEGWVTTERVVLFTPSSITIDPKISCTVKTGDHKTIFFAIGMLDIVGHNIQERKDE